MRYFLHRMRRSAALKPRALCFVLLPPLLYLFFSALVPDRYKISMGIEVERDAPLAKGLAVPGAAKAGDFLDRPELLLENQLALMELNRHVYGSLGVSPTDNFINTVRAHIQAHMSLTVGSDKSVRVLYVGENRHLGRILVNFFSRQLLGYLGRPVPRDAELSEEALRALWRPDRLGPMLWVTMVSLVLLLLFLILLEWMDPSLKTVRQAARYLDLPVLGTVPNLETLDGALKDVGAGDRGRTSVG